MQQHAFARPRFILAAVVFSAAAFLGARNGWAQPVKAGYPNPAWNVNGDGNGNLIGNVKRSEPVPGAPLNVTGTRVLSFDDLINANGTNYALYLWQDGDPVPGAPVANFTKGPGQAQPFTYTATLAVNDGPNIAGNTAPYNVHRFWNWRVDVSNGSGTTTGDVWQFRVPLEAPTNNSTDVSVYCKFEWEASADYTTGVTTEGIYIIDPNAVPSQVGKWYSGTTTTAPNTALTHKVVDLFPKPPAFYGSAYPDYREFWIHDATYLFQGYPRLQPSTTYQWRIWYTSTTGIPLANASIQLDLLEDLPAGQTATFTIYDPAGNGGKGLTVPVTLTGEIDPTIAGSFYTVVSAAIAGQAPPGSNISLITVTDSTVAGTNSPILTLTWPVAGTAGNSVTVTIPTASAPYLATTPAPVPPATAANFANGVTSKGFYGPIYSFTTVSEAYVNNVDGDASSGYDPAVQSLIVYWQHPQGRLARDPEENVTTFEPLASQLQAIHQNDLEPTVKTLIFGTEQMAASYGGLDTVALNNIQQVYVPDITQWPGWYTFGGATAVKGAYDTGQYNKRVGTGYPQTLPVFPLFYSSADAQPHPWATQDRYSEWVAKGIRTWLEDAANQLAFNALNEHAWLPNLQYVVLLGDANRVAPSFYYYYAPFYPNENNRWLPTDFFYATQNGVGAASLTTPTAVVSTSVGTKTGTSNSGGFQVSRIPVRMAPYITIDQSGNTFPPTPIPSPFGPPYYDPLPFLSKIRDYCDILNSAPTDAAKNAAFDNWFHQVAMIDGATEYYKWYQFFPGLAQYLLSMQVQDNSLSPKRDAFSGMVVREFDLNGLDTDVESYTTTGGEALTLSNILGRLSIDNGYDLNSWNTNTADADVPGFVYLLARGATNYGGKDADSQSGLDGETLAGGVLDLTPSYLNTTWVMSQQDPTLNGSPAPLSLTTDLFPTYIPSTIPAPNPVNFPTPTTKARPIVVSPANVITRFDNALWGTNPNTSLGEAAILAQGGPIAIAGFTSGRYQSSVQYSPAGQAITAYTGPTDENEGYEFTTITNGTADLTPFSADTDAVIGKIELTSYMAQQYGLVTAPVVGDLFNNALAQYVTTHLADFTVNGQREATTIFGATLLGDCAVSMPGREPVTTGDYTRPQVAESAATIRPATTVTGYSPVSQYNSQNMPVNVIPHYTPGANGGSVVTLQIQTSAPFIRVRVFTPFNQNTSYVSGEWAGGLGDMTAIAAVPGAAGTSIATNELICQTAAGAATVTFNALTPSIYFVIVQAQSPAWTGAIQTDPYRWLQERWFYFQAVNQFVRQTVDSVTGSKINLLVVDMDQHDRYYLNGAIFTQHQLNFEPQHVLPPAPPNIINSAPAAPWDNMADTFYVDPTQPDGTGINPGTPPEDVSDSPALPFLNSVANNGYEY